MEDSAFSTVLSGNTLEPSSDPLLLSPSGVTSVPPSGFRLTVSAGSSSFCIVRSSGPNAPALAEAGYWNLAVIVVSELTIIFNGSTGFHSRKVAPAVDDWGLTVG